MSASASGPLDGLTGAQKGGGRATDWSAPAPSIVNATKAGIVAVMKELDRPTTSYELYAIWGRRKPLSVFDYHLSTLVCGGFAEIVSGPELHFRLKAPQIGRA